MHSNVIITTHGMMNCSSAIQATSMILHFSIAEIQFHMSNYLKECACWQVLCSQPV